MNRLFTIILVAIIGILLGLGIIAKQGKDPAIEQILAKQDQILERTSAAGDLNLADFVAQQKVLENRIVKLEADLKQMKNGGPAAAQPGPAAEDYAKAYEIPVESSAIAGPQNAPVTIVEFVDFQCPFCARFHQPVVDVLKAYPEKVNYIIKNFPLPFHPNARPAAKVALAAGEQGKYHEMANKLLENGNMLGDSTYDRLATELGLDMAKLKKDLQEKDAVYESIIDKDMQLGEAVDVRGTPTFYLNGRKTMARDFARLKAEVDAALAK